jgi:hypothetical protein
MAYKKKTWVEKRNDTKDFPRVEKLTGKMTNKWGEGTIVIPSPLEVNQLMNDVKKGQLTTINDLRKVLAERHNATIACPICTGIFSVIAARAAEEEREQGKKRITPFWRTLKSKGELNPKYPGGIQAQIEKLEAEGHEIIHKGNRFFVKDFEKKLKK